MSVPQHENPMVANLLSLSSLDNSLVISVLAEKYKLGEIYTWVGGDILISINPNCPLPSFYTEEKHKLIHQLSDLRSTPHVYAISEQCLRRMNAGDRFQSILISGLSGSGKTEASKYILRYLVRESSRGRTKNKCILENQIEEALLNCNPILEAFGNAHTECNNNSSRFGRFLSLQYNGDRIVGASLQIYLLEKTRTIFDPLSVRSSFRVFQSFLGSLSEEAADAFGLANSVSAVKENEGVEKNSNSWTDIMNAFNVLDFADVDVKRVHDILTAIILLNYVRFVPSTEIECPYKSKTLRSNSVLPNSENMGSDAAIHPEDLRKIHTAGRLLGLPDGQFAEEFGQRLITRFIQAGSSLARKRATAYASPCTVSQAREQRDGLVKAIYGSLFDVIVRRINTRLSPVECEATAELGILDMFGFEKFVENGFEQFCINYANERLHQYFMRIAVTSIYEELHSEGITHQTNFSSLNKALSTRDSTETLQAMRKCANLLDEVCVLNRLHRFDKTDASDAKDPRESDWLRRLHLEFGHSGVLVCEAAPRSHRSCLLDVSPSINSPSSKSPSLYKRSSDCFTVHHFAGPVVYSTSGFVAKNLDRSPTHLLQWISGLSQGESFLRTVLHQACSVRQSELKSTQSNTKSAYQNSPTASSPPCAKTPNLHHNRRSNTVFGNFKTSVDALLIRLDAHKLSFIRCLRPNLIGHDSKVVSELRYIDKEQLFHQLQTGGLFCAIQVLQSSYPARFTYDEFIRRYRLLGCLVPASARRGSSFELNTLDRSVKDIEQLRDDSEIHSHKHAVLGLLIIGLCSQQWCPSSSSLIKQFGRTRVHLTTQQLDRLDSLRSFVRINAAKRIQRAYLRYRDGCRLRFQAQPTEQFVENEPKHPVQQNTTLTIDLTADSYTAIEQVEAELRGFPTFETHLVSRHRLATRTRLEHLWNPKRIAQLHCLIPFAWRRADPTPLDGFNHVLSSL